jgi:hypothetical protein
LESTAKKGGAGIGIDGLAQRIGKGIKGDPYLYFAGGK